MDLTIAWLLVLTCANIGLLALVVYAIIKPRNLYQGVQGLSSVVARLDGQLDDVRRMMFGDVVGPEMPPMDVAEPAPAKKVARKTTRKPAKKAAPRKTS